MCSKFVLANWICLAKSLRKWLMADCYFKLRELQYPLSLAAEGLHLEFHGGSSSGLTQVTPGA